MLWLTWHMWILLLLAFAGGVITGWIARARSDEPEPVKAAAPAAPVTVSPASPGATPGAAPAPAADGGAEAVPAAAPDPQSALAMIAPQQAPGADAGPVTAGPAGETSGGALTPEPAAMAAEVEDEDLTQIRGLGPKAAQKLAEAGVTRIAQIAGWSDEDAAAMDALVGGRGRVAREDWVGQARALTGR